MTPLSLRTGLACLMLSILSGNARLRAAEDDPLARLRSGHPRLLVTEEGLAAAVAAARADPVRARLHARIVSTAAECLDEPELRLAPPGGDMLDEARTAVRRIVTCAFAYRLSRDERFAARARRDMLTAAGFPHWNPDHFLDTAELSFALAIGYDWLQPQLSSADRAEIRRALKEKSLAFAAAAYAPGGPSDPRVWWSAVRTNWNEVGNAGLLSAALALADEEPALARSVIAGARATLPIALSGYRPDGAWPEGPGYWAYGTTYAVIALAEMESALGTDFGLGAAPGFDRTANFRLAVQSPDGPVFNFSDSAETVQDSPAYAWLAERYRLPAALAHSRRLLAHSLASQKIDNRFFALHAIWYPAPLPEGPSPPNPASVSPPLDWHFRGPADLAFFRSSWTDRDALFVGFKAGKNAGHHAHLDLGSFVLDADGQRWARDLGVDDYNLPGYFTYDGPRWNYFRINNRSHNTVTPVDALQRAEADAPIVAFGSRPDRAFAVADLTTAYPEEARSLRRGLAVLDRARVLVEDEFEPVRPESPLHWVMATGARIDLSADGRTATLTQNQRTLRAEVLGPSDARFRVASARPPTAAENPNAGTSLLALDAQSNSGTQFIRLAVLLTPVGPKWPPLPPPAVTPLGDWR